MTIPQIKPLKRWVVTMNSSTKIQNIQEVRWAWEVGGAIACSASLASVHENGKDILMSVIVTRGPRRELLVYY